MGPRGTEFHQNDHDHAEELFPRHFSYHGGTLLQVSRAALGQEHCATVGACRVTTFANYSTHLHALYTRDLRYLLFLRDRSTISKFSEEDAIIFQNDVDSVRACFVNSLTGPSGKLLELFSYLDDMTTLIRFEFSQPTVQSLLQSLTSKYRGEGREIAKLMIDCCLKLRPVCSSYHKKAVEGILEKASSGRRSFSYLKVTRELFS